MATIKKKARPSILQERRRRAFIFRTSLVLGILILLFTASLVCSWQSYFQIQDIEVVGNQVVGTENIVLTSKVALANNYAWIWPRSFFLWYPKSEIQNNLLSQFPRLKNIDIGIKGKNTIHLDVEERKPYVVWCADKTSLTDIPDSKNCYVLDRYGFVFDRAPKFSGHLFWHFYGEFKDGQNIGSNYLTPEIFHNLSNFMDEISKKGLDVIGLESFSSDGYYKLYLSNNVYILISNNQDFDITLRNLNALIEQKDMDLRNPDVSSRLEYVDLRFGNKINYKEKASQTEKTNQN